jgi:hypothetical protein
VDVYDIESGKWIESFPLPEHRTGHDAVVLNGEIWLIGGLGYSMIHNSVVSFDPLHRTWTERTQLPYRLDYPAAEVAPSMQQLN